MTLAPGPGPAEARPDFLGGSLLEGDSELEKRTRRFKRRAIVISMVLQVLFVAALILVPLLGKTENIAASVVFSPRLPYSPAHAPHRLDHHPIPQRPAFGFFQPTQIPTVIADRDLTPPTPPPIPADNADFDISRYTLGDGARSGVPFAGSSNGPQPPEDPRTPPQPRMVRVSGLVQEGKLLTRVQPIYPPLAVQVHREGRVELHAIIATDGSIQSLEVLTGDPFFIPSALTAVRQWRYSPTNLHGQPVEVDTHITVIYTLH